MEKRYQVFVSSTFQDLRDERQEVLQALLELDCFPSSMELFPAANDDQWTLIKRVIEDCDYYVLIVGGRYGSIGPDGLSYTEMEYRHALHLGKPIIGFLHKDPGSLPANRSENTPEGRQKLETFRGLVQRKMVRFWSTPSELGSIVSRSLISLIRSTPAVGWVRADRVPREDLATEVLRLKRQTEELERELAVVRVQAPSGSEDLAQGNEPYEISYSFRVRRAGDLGGRGAPREGRLSATWNDIFAEVAPLLMTGADDQAVEGAIVSLVVRRTPIDPEHELESFHVAASDIQTIKIQLRALSLITRGDAGWVLTPYGDTFMTRLRAIRGSGEK